MDSQRTSFYIPAVGDMSENKIKCAFWDNNIGSVKRVDYFENAKGVRCAFVHFNCWVENADTQYIWEQIDRYGSYKFWFTSYEYFILRKMTCAEIPETSMNIHQIASKICELEKRISEQDELIAKLKNNSVGVSLKTDELIDESINELDTGMILNYSESDSDKSYDYGYDYNYSYNYENRMKKIAESMVDSLVGPRWTDEDDLDSKNNTFVIADSDSDSKTSFDSNNSKRMRFTAEFCDNE